MLGGTAVDSRRCRVLLGIVDDSGFDDSGFDELGDAGWMFRMFRGDGAESRPRPRAEWGSGKHEWIRRTGSRRSSTADSAAMVRESERRARRKEMRSVAQGTAEGEAEDTMIMVSPVHPKAKVSSRRWTCETANRND